MLRPAKLKITRTGSHLCETLSHGFQAVGSAFLHLTTIVLLCACIVFVNWVFGTTGDQSHLHPLATYGYIGCVLLYCLRCIPYLSIPFGITNILGKMEMKINKYFNFALIWHNVGKHFFLVIAKLESKNAHEDKA